MSDFITQVRGYTTRFRESAERYRSYVGQVPTAEVGELIAISADVIEMACAAIERKDAEIATLKQLLRESYEGRR